VDKRQPFAAVGFVLVLLFAAVGGDGASAQDRWPPWQSYGEAEQAQRPKQKRIAVPKQSEIDALNKRVADLREAGKTEEAIAAAKRALALTEQRYGRTHAATAAALTTLAELLVAQERYAEAEPLLKRALAIRQSAKQPDSGDIAIALYNLGKLYEKQGKTKEAAEHLERALAMRDRQLASDPSKPMPKFEGPVEVRRETREGGSAVGQGKAEVEVEADADAKRQAEAEAAAKARAEAEEQAKVAEASERSKAEEKAKAMAEAESRSAEVEPEKPSAEGAPPEGRVDKNALCKSFPQYCGPEEGTLGGIDGGQPAPDGKPATEEEIRDALKARPQTRALRRAAPEAAARNGDGAAPPADAAPEAAAPAAEPEPEPDILSQRSGGGGAPPMAAPPPGTLRTIAPTAPAPPPVMAAPPPPAASAPEVAAAPPPPEEKWDVVPVFFGTDRAEEANPKRLSYSSDRGRRLELGRALVTVPKQHEVPQVERPWALRIPYFNVTVYEEAEDPNKHFTMQEIKKLSQEDFLRLVRERLGGSSRFKDQALIFVHGYNTAFDNAVYRTAQIAYDLKFDGAPFLYSWPSGGAVASYTYDRESAGASKPHMRKFLEMVVKETGAKAVSIIAHSMGNQPLLDVLKDMKSTAPEGVVISQVILAAPDVDADSFTDVAQAINGMAKGITLYAASNDRALIVSRNFWGHYRAGDVPAGGPLVLPGVDTIDVTAASTDAFAINHSGYAQNSELLKDIAELIETGKRPPGDRNLRPERVTTDHGAYWKYAARPPSP
jgi:esterase/lipase superfamily enzyme/tetratricopeptide (TPR) repeat protein